MRALAVAGSRAYVGLTDSAWVTAFDSMGKQLPAFRVSNDPAPSTPMYYEHAVNSFFDNYPNLTGMQPLRQRILSVPRPPHMPAWHALFGAPNGTLWIQLTALDDSVTHLRATDSLGTTIGDLTLPFPFTIFEIGNDYILGRRENETGEQRVVVYRTGRAGETGR